MFVPSTVVRAVADTGPLFVDRPVIKGGALYVNTPDTVPPDVVINKGATPTIPEGVRVVMVFVVAVMGPDTGTPLIVTPVAFGTKLAPQIVNTWLPTVCPEDGWIEEIVGGA